MFSERSRQLFRATLLDPCRGTLRSASAFDFAHPERTKGGIRERKRQASEWSTGEGEKVEKATETERSKDGVIAKHQGLLEFGGTF